MSVALIQQALKSFTRTLSVVSWLTDEQARAQQVNTIRRYVNGAPDNFLTSGQAKVLNLPSGSDNGALLHQFADNYCPAILDTTLDRIQLTGIEADTEPEQTWIDDLLLKNRLDELQVNLHEATLRDGNGFLMIDAVEDGATGKRTIRLTQESAYDGFYGMCVAYETAASKQSLFAAKVWRITSDKLSDTVRLNMYYPNRIERYTAFVGGGIRPYGNDVNVTALEAQYQSQQAAAKSKNSSTPLALDPSLPPGYPPAPDDNEPSIIPWTMDNTHAEVIKNADGTVTVTGEPIGVPVIHFRHKGNSITTHGLSDLVDVIPLQDLLNRTLYDMAATSALSAFTIGIGVGFQLPTSVQPGQMISVVALTAEGKPAVPTPESNEWLKTVRIDQFQQADLVPYIGQLEWIKNEMFAVTNTPEMENASANASGESLRQREVKLIGKVKRFEVRNGNAWEDAMLMAARVQKAFTNDAPVLGTLNAQWADAEIRNDTTAQANALLLYTNGVIGLKKCIALIADIYDWDQPEQDEIYAEVMQARGQNQLGQNDANAVMDKLNRAKSGGTASANGAGGGTNGAPTPQAVPPQTVKIAGTLSSSGAADTPGA